MTRPIAILFLACSTLMTVVASSQTLSNGEDVHHFIIRHIDSGHVAVFSKSYCPHWRATRALLYEMNRQIDFTVRTIKLDLLDQNDGIMIQNELMMVTGQRTVPNIFIGGKPIGGNSDIQQMAKDGILKERLLSLTATSTRHS